jgi:endonuclease/exonuclease/phosphatase (EEP) superfamily protein YafD
MTHSKCGINSHVSSAIALVLLTSLTLISHLAWNAYLELTSHFKVQYLVISLLLLSGVWFCDRRKQWLLIGLFCVSIQLFEIVPWYWPPHWSGRSHSDHLRILQSNVFAPNRSYAKVLSLVQAEQPDLAIFQEVNARWTQHLNPLSSTYPFTFQTSEGLAIYSRLPLSQPVQFGTGEKSSIATHLTVNQQELTLVVTHPVPPLPQLFDSRNQQLREVGQYIQQQQKPVILVGDLNTTMWSPYYLKLVQKTGLKNARQGFGILPTWPIPSPYARGWIKRTPLMGLLQIPIDHCLVSAPIQVTGIHPGPSVDSDHLPLITDLKIPG